MTKNEELLEEAMNHVSKLQTVRMYDSTWDEYLQYIHESPKYKPSQKSNINWDVILFGYKVLSVIAIILLINTL
tara:strand:+ start:3273 stop:3494 length:222 start_codon:yes stop_codon:yes gene_type:complete